MSGGKREGDPYRGGRLWWARFRLSAAGKYMYFTWPMLSEMLLTSDMVPNGNTATDKSDMAGYITCRPSALFLFVWLPFNSKWVSSSKTALPHCSLRPITQDSFQTLRLLCDYFWQAAKKGFVFILCMLFLRGNCESGKLVAKGIPGIARIAIKSSNDGNISSWHMVESK